MNKTRLLLAILFIPLIFSAAIPVDAFNCNETNCGAPIIFQNDHDHHTGTPKNYTFDAMKADWDTPTWSYGLNQGRAQLVNGANGSKHLRIKMSEDEYGFANDGTGWTYEFRNSYNEAYIQYKIMFEDGFDFQKGGKIPGLAGGEGNTGNNKPNGYDGWSARMMWQRDGGLAQYVYHPDQAESYADSYKYRNPDGSLFEFQTGRWYTITNRVKMNTPGVANGEVEGFVDGTRMMYKNNFKFREVNSFSIDQVRFTVFYGGGDPSWAPDNDSYLNLDDFIISTAPISVTPTPSPAPAPAPTPPSEPDTGGDQPPAGNESNNTNTNTNTNQNIVQNNTNNIVSVFGNTGAKENSESKEDEDNDSKKTSKKKQSAANSETIKSQLCLPELKKSDLSDAQATQSIIEMSNSKDLECILSSVESVCFEEGLQLRSFQEIFIRTTRFSFGLDSIPFEQAENIVYAGISIENAFQMNCSGYFLGVYLDQ